MRLLEEAGGHEVTSRHVRLPNGHLIRLTRADDAEWRFRYGLVEPLVWEGVSEVLGEPERLRRGLQKMLEKEQEDSVVDHAEEAHV